MKPVNRTTNHDIGKPFEFKLRPECMSSSGLNVFRVLGFRYVYKYRKKIPTMRLEMYANQSKVVKFNNLPDNQLALDYVRKNWKNGDTEIYISLNDIRFLSYAFNHSSGISLYSSGFCIVEKEVF